LYTTQLYFESHITIEPCFNEKLEQLKIIVGAYGFRVADLLVLKRVNDKPQRSRFDSFCTTRGTNYEDVCSRTLACVRALEKEEFVVWRYKIENTLLDVNYLDRIEKRADRTALAQDVEF
jgi:hypothetical protein